MSPCLTIPGGVICYSPDYRIVVGGRAHLFEMHSYFGPSRLNRDGSISRWSLSKPVLAAIAAWQKQGSRVDDNCNCVWEKPE